MFYGSLKEGEIVKITDSNASAFKQFLQLIYLPEITFTMDHINEVLRLADKYDMLTSLRTCIPFLESQLTKENVVTVHQLAILLENSKLKEICEKWIRAFTNEVLKSEAFLECDQKVVEYILQSDVLECCETDILEACIKWAASSCQKNGLDEKNPKNLRNQLGNYIHLIRFGTMAEKDVSEILANKMYRELFTYDELADFFQMKMDKSFQPLFFKHTKRTTPLNTELTCQRIGMSGSVFLKSRESVWFSANVPVLLTRIDFGGVLGPDENFTHYHSDLEIVEYNTNTFSTNATSKILSVYNNCKIGYGYSVSLSSPVIINSRKLYEIRTVNARTNCHYNDTTAKLTQFKLNDTTTIQFHHDPSDNESSRRNFIHKFTFLQF